MANSYITNLDDMYKKLYQSKQTSVDSAKQKTLADLDSQETTTNNDYTNLINSINAKKQDAQQGFYNNRNTVAQSNAQSIQAIRDYMAKNNLMSSGENVDAMLRQSTNYNNNLGNIYSSEQASDRDFANQSVTADQNKAQALAAITSKRTQADQDALSQLQAYQDELDAQKLQAVNSYNLQQQQLSASRTSAARSAANSQSKSQQAAQQAAQKALQAQYDKYYDSGFTMKNKGYKDADGNYVSRYDNASLFDWLSKLDLPDEYKVKLGNDLGIENPNAWYSSNPYYNYNSSLSKYSGGR